MMPTLVDEPPEGEGWIHEIKHDGTKQYRTIVEVAAQLPCRTAIIDGEMVVQDEAGRADFHAMRAALSREPERLAFFAFDLPMLDGRDLRNEPLSERRRLLQDLVASADVPQIAFSGDVPGNRPGDVRSRQ